MGRRALKHPVCSYPNNTASTGYCRGCRCGRCANYKSGVSKKWRAANIESRRAYQTSWEYNVSKDEAAKWLAIPCCQICGGDKRLMIDHDHTSGRVRGRLCEGCNFGIGQFKDNPETLVKAAAYLRSKGIQTW